jgi:hypothetical protein
MLQPTSVHPSSRRRKRNGGHKVEWDDDRGLNRDGMNLPAQCIYIGCIDMEVTDEAEQEVIETLLLEKYRCCGRRGPLRVPLVCCRSGWVGDWLVGWRAGQAGSVPKLGEGLPEGMCFRWAAARCPGCRGGGDNHPGAVGTITSSVRLAAQAGRKAAAKLVSLPLWPPHSPT